MNLEKLSQGRDNNLNLLRIVAATAVLVSHSYVIVTGDSTTEPLHATFGISLGGVAVNVFFVISGFLVTASLCRSGNALDFVVSRCIRIFPALAVLLVLTVFVMGPLVSSLPLSEYFGPRAFVHFTKCLTLLGGISGKLPGVFAANPLPDIVNGSLWSMPWEVRGYLGLLLVWWITARGKNNGRMLLVATLCIALVMYVITQIWHAKNDYAASISMPLTLFALGSVMWQIRVHVSLQIKGLVAAAVLMCGLPFLSLQGFYLLFPFLLAYVVVYLAFAPVPLLQKYKHAGDYSYGLYLYAFPVQQLLVWALPEISIPQMVVYSFGCTMLFAVLSWHLIEKRFVAMKGMVVNRLSLSHSV